MRYFFMAHVVVLTKETRDMFSSAVLKTSTSKANNKQANAPCSLSTIITFGFYVSCALSSHFNAASSV